MERNPGWRQAAFAFGWMAYAAAVVYLTYVAFQIVSHADKLTAYLK